MGNAQIYLKYFNVLKYLKYLNAQYLKYLNAQVYCKILQTPKLQLFVHFKNIYYTLNHKFVLTK